MTKIEVQHDEAARKYYALVDGQESVCTYFPSGDKVLNFAHTFVPPAQRGRGIAEQLVQGAVEDARSRGFKIIPSCWYVRLYIDNHRELQDALAGG
jgi:predicted GNAT family acetyltransferase